MKKIKYLKIEQPIGTFYLTSLEASILAKIAIIERRNENPNAIQREASSTRIKEIAKYCGEADATFPTPIIIAVDENANIRIDENFIYFEENEILGDVIDGQHRLEGLKTSNFLSKFQMPVVLMFDLYPSQKAYVFSIINSKQTRVNMSLIYDLFALSEKRSPYKTCHETARALNIDKNSPFYNRLKMLGKKKEDQESASLSQGTFIKYLLELISKNPDEDTRKIKNGNKIESDKNLVLRQYFIDDQDNVIFKIILNLFNGVKDAFETEWNNPNEYIISKAIGFGAIIKAYPVIHILGVANNKLTQEFFKNIFINFKKSLKAKGIELNSSSFGSNEQARTKLANLIIDSIKEMNWRNNT
ncbi:DGQHR domain-containing protein [Chryseobacterium taeanense]|uniref:DGQHR domain-containing protein n=1 Tax=Chryseobacterium taeanense TaxID=311334 RepID=A0A1G8N8H2_9FLAO|nr:DGQHR domain-containing protein [Chryseobacterium taeanense]SDI76367.1 DGQHR domain-containing protein [Chryseobacterium taeanense]